MIPNDVKYIIKTLQSNNFEAYIVGGAVRNHYMKKPVNDWDITTNATPDIIENLFEHTYAVGKAFGTIVVKLTENYEVTTYREETGYDGRKPQHVQYADTIKKDLERRDFTMNAMYMDLEENIYDLHSGIEAINNKIIETVGNPVDRFIEDYLRVYRYVRFTAQYAFNRNLELDEKILEIPINKHISAERIREEFNKMLLSEKPSDAIIHLNHLNLLEYVFPEIVPCIGFEQHSKFHHLTVFEHLMMAVDHTPRDLIVRLAALCHDIGKPSTFELIDGEGHFYGHDKVSAELTERFLKRLKYDSATIQSVLTLINNHMRLLDTSNKKSVKKFMKKIGLDHLNQFLELRKADILSSKTNDDISSVADMRETFNKIIHEKEPLSVNDLAVNGHDIMSFDIHGKDIGILQKKLLEHVLDHPKENNKKDLINIIMNYKQKMG